MARDALTPPEGRTGRQSLEAHDSALGSIAAELAGFAAWRRSHDAAHITQTELLEGLGKRVHSLEHAHRDLAQAQRDHTAAEIARRPMTTKQLAAYGGVFVTIIGALATGGTQIIGALGSRLTSEARAQSREVAEQRVQQIDEKQRQRDLEEATARGFERGAAEQDIRWIERLAESDRKANTRKPGERIRPQ